MRLLFDLHAHKFYLSIAFRWTGCIFWWVSCFFCCCFVSYECSNESLSRDNERLIFVDYLFLCKFNWKSPGIRSVWIILLENYLRNTITKVNYRYRLNVIFSNTINCVFASKQNHSKRCAEEHYDYFWPGQVARKIRIISE